MFYIGCPTRYRTRHFFNNLTTEDIATKFEADYRHTLQTHSFSFLTQRTYSCNILIGVRIIKEMPGSVASGTHCICFSRNWQFFRSSRNSVFYGKWRTASVLSRFYLCFWSNSPVHISTLLFLKCIFRLFLPSTPNSNFLTNIFYAFLISPTHLSCLPTSSLLIDRRKHFTEY